jgi:hypothetical protein
MDLMEFLKNPLGIGMNALKSIIQPFLSGRMQGIMQGALGMNAGGLVPGYGSTDKIPAMLTPGEFVMNRGATAAIGSSALSRMNNGQSASMGETNISVNLTIQTSERIDPAYIRDRLMPTIKDELKKESRRGGYVLSSAGVR